MMADRPVTGQLDPRADLCASCRHGRDIVNDRGSRFLMCERAKTDARYAKYPPQPVLWCPGHEPKPLG